MHTLTFDLVTPQATFFSGVVHMVEAPGTLGDFGVLAGHMPFISTLRPGVVRVHGQDSSITRLFVMSGIAEVNASSCTILAEEVVNLEGVTRADAESRLLKARTLAEQALTDEAKRTATGEVQMAEALLAVVQ